jgi:hypothetical protein
VSVLEDRLDQRRQHPRALEEAAAGLDPLQADLVVVERDRASSVE